MREGEGEREREREREGEGEGEGEREPERVGVSISGHPEVAKRAKRSLTAFSSLFWGYIGPRFLFLIFPLLPEMLN